jgi:hypothetical protein
MELAADREGETAGGPERDEPKKARSPATQGRTKTAKGDEQIPRTPPAKRDHEALPPARPREPCPGAGPERALSEEHQARMTRTGGASTGATSEREPARGTHREFDQTAETRGTKTARAMRRPAWVP